MTRASRRTQRPLATKAGAAAFLMAAAAACWAGDNFSYTATVNSNSVYKGFAKVDDFLKGFDQAAIESLFAGYTTADAASFSASFRGIPVNVAFPTGGSSLLTFAVPSLGISESFTGATRDESQSQLEDYLKKNGSNILGRLMKEAARVSPNDPVAGNPGSLMGTMVATSFDSAFTAQGSQIVSGPPLPGDQSNQLGIGLRFGSYRMNDVRSSTSTIPLSYTWRFDSDPRKQVVLNMPFTIGSSQGAKMGNFAPSLSFRMPVTNRWSLTPTVGYGAAGSLDLGSVAQIVNGSLMSVYTFPVGNWSVSVGNMAGYYKTVKVSAGDFAADPGLSNMVYRNGIMIAQPVNLFGGDKIIEYSIVDTRYAGSALFMKWYDEAGITIGTARGRDGLRSYLRAGVSYLWSAGSSGFSMKFGYWF
ncbi:MAG: hypothetical protein ACK5YW_15725 [Betaproteobacteria bacterium]|jgi:hypothetical protein|nr:hypothetical protein [Rhodocyclaceae bacterium]MCA3136201.1 hypothetical protein [Rhodocyclaceae bacterium]MCA3143731.1 hypothetical protein [Rhodocyclaceae bacterium]MCA3147427.1 hypothetical protein [Rhodocyclaceae bacterium]MCE2899205.1 hypothetical protein [Betaproteobacteria bacterium]